RLPQPPTKPKSQSPPSLPDRNPSLNLSSRPEHLPTLSSRPERAKAGAVEGPGVVFLSASAPPQNHIPHSVIPTGASESGRSGGTWCGLLVRIRATSEPHLPALSSRPVRPPTCHPDRSERKRAQWRDLICG